LNLTFQQWKNYQRFGENDGLQNSFKVSVGGQLIPNPKGTKYVGRMQYRGGLYFNHTFIDLKDQQINDGGISIGLGLPIRKAYNSMINVAVTGGIRGTQRNDLIQENYIRFNFGLTLNEDWFRRHRYD
jgi:hypothetical protein